MKKLIFSISLLIFAIVARGEEFKTPKPDKLQSMYRLYYLAMGIEFKEGENKTDILPYVESAPEKFDKLLKPEEFEKIDAEWSNLKQDWQKKSLLLKSPADLGRSLSVTQTLRNHYVRTGRSASEIVSFNSGETAQLKLLKSFIQPNEENKTHFFVIGPDWCLSSMEYRVILEGLFKEFQNPKFVLHNIMIADPEQKIFESKFLKEILSSNAKQPLETVPVFLSLSFKDGKAEVLEEGDAIENLLEKHLIKHRGFLKGSLAPKRSIAQSPYSAQ